MTDTDRIAELEAALADCQRIAEMGLSNYRQAYATIDLIAAMIGEMFGPIASIESEEATLLRGPEPMHRGEAILEALQRVRDALDRSG